MPQRQTGVVEIWINPACSKCRSAKAALDEAGIDYVEKRYLEDPPSQTELSDVLDRLGLEPWEVVRLDEHIAKELGMSSWDRDAESRVRWIEAMADHPKLIQRPIITASDATTLIARDNDSLQAVIAIEQGRVV